MSESFVSSRAQGHPQLWVSLAHVKNALAHLHPAYFALVMATGIVSMDCHLLGLSDLSQFLFVLNVVAFAVLLLLYAVRAAHFRQQFIQDCFSHKRAFGFFTLVAATNVLGSQFAHLAKNIFIAHALWWTALILWFVCTYCIFVFLIVKQEKPKLEEGVNGGWLVAVVATQSICVLGSQIRPQLLGSEELLSLFLMSFWLFGGMLYLWMMSLIFYRYMFFKFEPSDLIPPYWINMGAMAISTLAGAELALSFGSVEPVSSMLPFVKGVTALYCATATWWIPMLLILGVWRHGLRRFKFKYDPLYWGLVFPLGMYSVCVLKLSYVLAVPALALISRVFLCCALIAWLVTFLSMAQRPLYASLLVLHVVRSRRNDGGLDE